MYRPPNNSADNLVQFFNYFEAFLHNTSNISYPLFICTDSNFNLLNINTCKNSQKYLNLLHSYGFLQLIHKATRINGDQFSLIDHICSKNETISLNTGVIVNDISDHFTTYICLNSTVPKITQKIITSRNFSSDNVTLFRDALNQITWENVKIQSDVNVAFDEFWNTFNSLFDIYFPLTSKKFNRNIHKINPYLTKGLLTSRVTKNMLHKKSITEPSPSNSSKFKLYRNLYNTLIRKSKQLYFQEKLQSYVNNPRKTWEVFNEVIGKPKSKVRINEIKANDTVLSNDFEIAEHFNNFFGSVGQTISNSVNKISTDPLSYMKINPNVPVLSFDEITPTYVKDVLGVIPAKKSLDVYEISNFLLSNIKEQISIPLAHIFNLSLKKGIYPEKFKISRVIPVFKSGDHLSADNYRPISLVCSLAKALDKIVATKLTNHLEINKLLYPYQFGFQKKVSTESNLIHMTNYIGSALNDNKYCIGIFLDLKKAFDVVPHDILLKKTKILWNSWCSLGLV